MRCKDVEKVLSAYANDELSPSEKSLVDEHLENCARCRDLLSSYILSRNYLKKLRVETSIPDMKASIISNIKLNKHLLKRQSVWNRRALVVAPILMILIAIVTFLLWNPWTGSEKIIAQAYSAMSSVKSYRLSVTRSSDIEPSIVVYASDFVAPDLYHITQSIDDKTQEFIYIGDSEYFKGNYQSFLSMKLQANYYTSMLTREATLRYLNMLGDIRKLEDETLEGIVCSHYQGRYDIEKHLLSWQESRKKIGLAPFSEEDLSEMREEMHANYDSMTFELWIGKTDHLLRQWKINREEQNDINTLTSYVMYKFYDFNESIEIIAPAGPNGKLLEGWVSTTPLQQSLSKEVESSIDDSDPSVRKLIYNLTISNVSDEPVSGINVDFIPMLPLYDESLSLWIKEGNVNQPIPQNLKPGESFTYEVTFGYDATKVLPEEIETIVANYFVYVGYINVNGEQRAERISLEVPESVHMPQSLPVYELKPVGEYRIKEPGASFASGQVVGEINGKKYLFVLVDTRNSATPEENLGVLILDITNPLKPLKVSYLQAPDDVTYMMNSAFSGTTLYVNTGNYLWTVDVSNPNKPKEMARFTGTFNSIVINGNYAFLNRYNRITILDISNPANPEIAGNLELVNEIKGSLDVNGNYLLAWERDRLNIIDISSPSLLKIINSYVFTLPPDFASGSPEETSVGEHVINGNFVYVVLHNEADTGILIMDISYPASPRELSFLDLKQMNLSSLFATESEVYAISLPHSGSDRQMRLNMIDVSDANKPFVAGIGKLPYYWSFFNSGMFSHTESFTLIDKYLYWFIGNDTEDPVAEIFDLLKY
jgi:hypothetical protein